MAGFSGKAVCPECGSEQDVTFWEDEWRGKNGRLYLRYTECQKCGHKWADDKQNLYNIGEILRVLGLRRFDGRTDWYEPKKKGSEFK